MKRPPRKKDAPIIGKRLIARVLFSASVIVCGVLFIYIHELSDGSMSRRDQTMVSNSVPDGDHVLTTFLDIHLLRLPRFGVCNPKSGSRLRHSTKPRPTIHGFRISNGATRADIFALHAVRVPNGIPCPP